MSEEDVVNAKDKDPSRERRRVGPVPAILGRITGQAKYRRMTYREELLHVFHTTPDDLAMNRAGLMSDRQAARLVHSGYRGLAAFIGLSLALFGIVLGVALKPLHPIQWILTCAAAAAMLA